MDFASFNDLYLRLQALYQQGEYGEALELSDWALDEFPERATVLDYWRMTMSARIGDNAAAMNILRAALGRGQWYAETLLRRSPSFKALQDEPEFETLIALNQAVAELDQAERYPLYTLRPENRCQAGGPPCPTLIGLHGNATTIESALGFWRPAALSGWLVAAVQSSQALWREAYVWDNRDITERDVRHDYAVLEETYAVDPQRTIIAGHAMGGEVALWLALKDIIPVRGFMLINPAGPWLDDLEQWKPLLREREGAELRGYIITGEEDLAIAHDNIQTLLEWLNRAGIHTAFESVVGMEHDHAPEYDPAILRGLNFIME